MVSYPEVVDRTVAVHHPPPPPSTSRLSHSSRRQHRHGRSHYGGSSFQPQNEFPIFAHTGDVEIVIAADGHEKRYILHRLILAQCSGFFEASTSEEWSRTIPSHPDAACPASPTSEMDRRLTDVPESGTGPLISGRVSLDTPIKKRWRYELDWQHRGEDEEPILVQKPATPDTIFGGDIYRRPPSSTKPSYPGAGFFRSVTNLSNIQSAIHLPSSASTSAATKRGTEDVPLLRDYDNLFRIFYNHPPILNSVNIASAYSESKALLCLADMYDALPVVGPRVDHHLLRFSSRLFKQIARYPPSYLKLGYLARSRIIFSEALIHVVGQWPNALPHLQSPTGPSVSPLPDAVLDLIEDKFDDLEDLKARVEAKLFRLTLTTPRGERVSPSNAYLDWLAVSLFRQWLVESTTPPPAPILKNPLQPDGVVSQDGSRPQHAYASRSSHSHSSSQPVNPQFAPGRVYRLIGSSSPDAYLTHDDLKRFLKLHPTSDSLYTRDNLKRFERKLEEIKRLARDIVKPLVRNFLELDLKSSEVRSPTSRSGSTESTDVMLLPYLTCTRVEEGDFPWD